MSEVVESLPAPWRSQFEDWARRRYDNDKPVETFISISQGESSVVDPRPIERIREWFRRQRT